MTAGFVRGAGVNGALRDIAAPPAEPREVARLTIGERPCRLLCVDDVLPRHHAARDGTRPRFVYIEGEIAHFELGGHSFALVSDEPAPAATPSRNSATATRRRKTFANC